MKMFRRWSSTQLDLAKQLLSSGHFQLETASTSSELNDQTSSMEKIDDEQQIER